MRRDRRERPRHGGRELDNVVAEDNSRVAPDSVTDEPARSEGVSRYAGAPVAGGRPKRRARWRGRLRCRAAAPLLIQIWRNSAVQRM
jgi:hypothetical protein